MHRIVTKFEMAEWMKHNIFSGKSNKGDEQTNKQKKEKKVTRAYDRMNQNYTVRHILSLTLVPGLYVTIIFVYFQGNIFP